MNKVIYFLCLLTLCSCASSGVEIITKNCYSKYIWARDNEKTSEMYTLKRMGFGVRKVFVKNIIEDNDLSCRNIKDLRVEVKRNKSDALLSLVPGFSSQTIIVKFNKTVIKK